MDRRDFFKRAFAAGVVATVPVSVLSITDDKIVEHVEQRPIDFNTGCILYKDGKLIAHSEDVKMCMRRDVYRSYDDKFISGPSEYRITMINPQIAGSRCLESFYTDALLDIAMNDVKSFKGKVHCQGYMSTFELHTGDIHLEVSGAVKLIFNQG